MQELHVFCYDSARVVLRSQPRALASSAGAFKRPPVVADFSLDGALPCMLCSVHLKSGPAGARAEARTLGRVTLPALVAEHGARARNVIFAGDVRLLFSPAVLSPNA